MPRLDWEYIKETIPTLTIEDWEEILRFCYVESHGGCFCLGIQYQRKRVVPLLRTLAGIATGQLWEKARATNNPSICLKAFEIILKRKEGEGKTYTYLEGSKIEITSLLMKIIKELPGKIKTISEGTRIAKKVVKGKVPLATFTDALIEAALLGDYFPPSEDELATRPLRDLMGRKIAERVYELIREDPSQIPVEDQVRLFPYLFPTLRSLKAALKNIPLSFEQLAELAEIIGNTGTRRRTTHTVAQHMLQIIKDQDPHREFGVLIALILSLPRRLVDYHARRYKISKSREEEARRYLRRMNILLTTLGETIEDPLLELKFRIIFYRLIQFLKIRLGADNKETEVLQTLALNGLAELVPTLTLKELEKALRITDYFPSEYIKPDRDFLNQAQFEKILGFDKDPPSQWFGDLDPINEFIDWKEKKEKQEPGDPLFHLGRPETKIVIKEFIRRAKGDLNKQLAIVGNSFIPPTIRVGIWPEIISLAEEEDNLDTWLKVHRALVKAGGLPDPNMPRSEVESEAEAKPREMEALTADIYRIRSEIMRAASDHPSELQKVTNQALETGDLTLYGIACARRKKSSAN